MQARLSKLILLTAGLLLLTGSVCGLMAQQDYLRKNYSTTHGMSHDYVHAISQDKTGFLWISTWDGVCRFNGNDFRNYYHQPNEINTLPFFAVSKILCDSLNNVWAITPERPLTRYDRAKDIFVREITAQGEELIVDDITLCSDSELWLAQAGGLKRYHPPSGKVTAYNILNHDTGNPFRFDFLPQITQDNRGTIWIAGYRGNEFGIFKGEWNRDSALMLHPYPPVQIGLFPSSKQRDESFHFEVCQTNSGDIWLFSIYGLFRYHQESNLFVKYETPPHPEEFSGKPSFSWCDDEAGLFQIETSTGKVIHIPPEKGNYITAVFRDRNGTIWSGELNEYRENIGLNRFSPIPTYFRHFLTDKNQYGNSRLVFPILKLKTGEILAGTRHSDHLFSIAPDGTLSGKKFFQKFEGKDFPRVRTMISDSAGIWMGCTDNYLVRYDFNSRKFQERKISAKSKAGDDLVLNIHNILSRDGRLVINGSEGIYLYDPGNDSLALMYPFGIGESGFTLIEDGRGGYWTGVNNNTVIHLDKEFSEVERFSPGKGLNNVEHICPGDSGDIWVALMGGGLGHVRPETGETTIYTTADGLSNNTLYSIIKDHRGELWISTNQGISRFSPKTGLFRNFGKEDGLRIREFNSDSRFQAPDGEIFFGGIGGFVAFHPDSIHEISSEEGKVNLIIEAFRVSGISRHFNKPVDELNTVTLTQGDNNFQVTFSSLNFNHPEKINYRYRLGGESGLWTETDYLHRNISFANLSPGKYMLEVESADLTGRWDAGQMLLVIIPPFFYQTILFRFLIGSLIIGILSIIAWLYIRQIVLKARQQQDELRLESLRGQMNPHFIFNSLNSINYFISNNDKLLANQYIADFSRLIRSILDNMTTNFIPLSDEINSLRDYLKLEHLRFNDKFDYSIKSLIEDDPEHIYVFPGMVQPFVENAIWHGIRNLEGRTGFLKIEFSRNSHNAVVCTVEDDGVGRKLSHQLRNDAGDRKSRGISIVAERLRIMNDLRKTNYGLRIEDLYPEATESGTRVVIDIPVKMN